MSEKIVQYTENLARLAEMKFGVKLNPSIVIRDLGRRAGTASFKMGKFQIELNQQLVGNWEFMTSDTIPHEIAHLVMFAQGRIAEHHGPRWVEVCKALGGKGTTTHKEAVKPTRTHREWEYVTSTGKPFVLKTVRHNRLQRGQVQYYKLANGDRIYKEGYKGPHNG